MRYKISGKHIDVGERLQSHVQTEISKILGKYAERPMDEYVCKTAIHLSTVITINSKAKANDIYVNFDK